MVMVEMKVLVIEMMMMIPIKSGAMEMTMAMIFPLWEGISPVDFCLPESFSLSSVFWPTEVAVSNSEPPPSLRFLGMMKYVKGRDLEWARAPSHRAGAARGQATPPMCEAALWLLSTSPSSFRSLLIKYNFLAFFWNFLDLQNMVLFSAET
jgi:hypothetical protein